MHFKKFLLMTVFSFIAIILPKSIAAQTTNTITVDFLTTIRQISPLAFSMDISGYGQGSYLMNDAVHKKRLTDLHLGMMRMHLAYKTLGDPTSTIVCHGSGCATSVSGDSWVSGIKAARAEPVLIITVSGTRTTAQDQTDAVNLIKHFNKETNNPVKRWIIGNELDNSGNPDHMDATTYSNRFNALYDAMKAIDPMIKIGGPATAYYDTSFIDTFLTLSGSKTDFIDFHTYGQGGSENKSEAVLLNETAKYSTHIIDLQNRIKQKVPTRIDTIEIQIGEWNLDWNSDPKQYTHFNTIWAASVLGKTIQEGGLAMQFADKNGALGALYETSGNGGTKNDPMPIYHAYGMFTGENLFPHFGTKLVKTTTAIPNIEVYASDNPKMIIVINKNQTVAQQATLTLKGITNGTAVIWRKDTTVPAISPPKNIETITFTNGLLTYTFPQYSVSTIVLNSPNTEPTNPTTNSTVQLKVFLHGIGKSGDNLNPLSAGTASPLHTQRTINLEFFNATNQPLPIKTGTLTYNSVHGNFTGDIDIGSISNGAYTARVTVPGYLRKTNPGIILVTSGQSTALPEIYLATGDSNHDNALSILDYNIILDCFSDLSPARNCSNQTKQVSADLTDDGNVNQFDYNLFLRELSVQAGQ